MRFALTPAIISTAAYFENLALLIARKITFFRADKFINPAYL
jgi:hypothetical protein